MLLLTLLLACEPVQPMKTLAAGDGVWDVDWSHRDTEVALFEEGGVMTFALGGEGAGDNLDDRDEGSGTAQIWSPLQTDEGWVAEPVDTTFTFELSTDVPPGVVTGPFFKYFFELTWEDGLIEDTRVEELEDDRVVLESVGEPFHVYVLTR